MQLEGLRDARWIAASRWAALPAAFATLATGCNSSTQCDCPDTAIFVRVPELLAASVIDVTLSGAACANANVACAAQTTTGACTAYRIVPSIDGACHVDVDFSKGGPRFSADAHVVHNSGCCGGFITDPPSAGAIDVPDGADGGASDAGSTNDTGSTSDATVGDAGGGG